ncbi:MULTISPECIES: ATP synthase F1 subunit epsilon [unclassified Synechococcus]|uniref:ATP synthase epsilon chain n=1 Tax=Synechococcus sp. (strain JA-2-3B'a(2-13)) TaxID=321332 RepID=ATPE_SYNJB|nr:ATP synthase F1 subunit epsilon [Synechococcus sp. JA-2-3B'a(2-13)]Q2JJK2.1 RecName: Full=ATP synthase epsilon chain; AltName: Full=ATP synthase F1 sector epsilon subunit; AltName: Full=F-ATPase epsilon subunit [Synechococcus sp. JA-2-3B'a(2-13)]ABD03165.1 ATP synthase F1, epsilon subunit [Synechococcus sp. JA-2-3B'a(2-13)]
MTLMVRVITPDRTVWDAPSEEVILPATSGQLGILTGHAPLLTAIGNGVMRVKADGKWLAIAVMGGFAEVENNEVTVLVNRAERGEKVDKAAAQALLDEASKVLNTSSDKQERLQAKLDQQRARALIQAAEMGSKTGS